MDHHSSPVGPPGPNQFPPTNNPPNQAWYPGQIYPPNIGFNLHTPPQGLAGNDNVTGSPIQDEECAEAKGFDFTDKSIRRGFIRKVFSILMLQLLLTVAVVALFIYHEPTKMYVQNTPELLIAALVVLLVTMFALACCGTLRRKSPANYILLVTFTLAESFFLGVISSNYESDIVLMALGLTAGICLALTLFAFQTKLDFTACGGILFVTLLLFVVVGFSAIFIGSKIFSLMYASFGALLFCVYLVYDIQIMMGGKHKYSISPEEYIFAALNLYLDVINIFLYILAILGMDR